VSRGADLLTWSLTAVTFLGCAFLGLLGLGIGAFGLFALFGGIHGGPLYAGIMVLFGAALAFVAYYLVKLFVKSERKRISTGN
jgi:hypothetical protein